MARKKKKIRLVEFLHLGQFSGWLMLSVGRNIEETKEFLKTKLKDKDWDKDTTSMWIAGMNTVPEDKEDVWWAFASNVEKGKEKKRIYYIVIPDEFKFTDYDYSRLAHEVLHICQFHLKDILDRNKEWEAEAYFHTHLMNRILEKIREASK